MNANTLIILKEVELFAEKAHGEQQRKYKSERYIVHPIRVMNLCNQYTDDIAILSAALLHDVLEDTDVLPGELNDFLNDTMGQQNAERTMKYVVELTEVYTKHAYPALNRRSRKDKENTRLEAISAEAQTIKYADIYDNTSEVLINAPEFAKVYLFECKAKLQAMNKGNQDLYHLANETVSASINKLKMQVPK